MDPRKNSRTGEEENHNHSKQEDLEKCTMLNDAAGDVGHARFIPNVLTFEMDHVVKMTNGNNGNGGVICTSSHEEIRIEEEDYGDDDKVNQILFEETWFSRIVGKIENAILRFYSRNKSLVKKVTYILLLAIYMTYFAYCMNHRFGDEGSVVLLVITTALLWKVFCKILQSKGVELGVPTSFYVFAGSKRGRRIRSKLRYFAYFAATVGIAAYLIIGVFPRSSHNIQSFFGILGMVLVCFILSAKPSKVNWYPVFWSFVIQFAVGTLTLRTKLGYDIFKWLGNLFQTLFNFSDAGSKLIISKDFKEGGLSISSTGIIIFTNAFIFLMNQWGVIEFIVLKLGRFLAFCLETGPVESVVAAANIFIGLAEAPLMIRCYLPTITKSELHTVMTCGYASISGGVMGLFIQYGAPANHLLTAAVISAPAALAISKLMYPETERVCLESQTNIRMVDTSGSNPMSAFSEGAVLALTVAASVWANMLAFVSMMDLLDALAIWFGARAGLEGFDFGVICSYLLYPLAFAMGVDVRDCKKIGKMIGVKLVATPFVAYGQLGDLIENRLQFEAYTSSGNGSWHYNGPDIVLESTNVTLVEGVLMERTEVIATYAMCGLSAFAAIGITLGALIPLCPARKPDIVSLVFRSFIAGNVACFATGAIAGVLMTGDL